MLAQSKLLGLMLVYMYQMSKQQRHVIPWGSLPSPRFSRSFSGPRPPSGPPPDHLVAPPPGLEKEIGSEAEAVEEADEEAVEEASEEAAEDAFEEAREKEAEDEDEAEPAEEAEAPEIDWACMLPMFLNLWMFKGNGHYPGHGPSDWPLPFADLKEQAYSKGVAHGFAKGFGKACTEFTRYKLLRKALVNENLRLGKGAGDPELGRQDYADYEEIHRLFSYFESHEGVEGDVLNEMIDHRAKMARKGRGRGDK